MDARPWHQHYDQGVPTTVEVPDVRLDALLRATAARHPSAPAISFFGRTTTYRELDRKVDRMAAALQGLGLEPGDRVSVFAANCPQVVIAYEAIWRAGGVVVPSNPLYTTGEFQHQAADAGSRFAVCMSLMYSRVRAAVSGTRIERVIVTNIKEQLPQPLRTLFTVFKERRGGHRVDLRGDDNAVWWADVVSGVPPVPDPVDVAGDDPAVLMYTGGTTGVPKGAVLLHRNLVANAKQAQAWSTGLVEGGEVMLSALPLTHSYGMTVSMNHSIDRGYLQVILADPRDLKALIGAIEKHRVTLFPGVPALYAAITSHPLVTSGKADLSSIKQCISGAAGLPPDTQRRFQDVTGGRLVEGYGLSEASPVTHCNPLAGQDRLGTIGVPMSSTDCRIVDEESESRAVPPGERGVLCISGPQVMAGYWNRPDESAAALRTDETGRTWLHTGDVAVMDEDGFFRIVDRKKDLILAAGGMNVYPREIEDVLVEHPAVLEAGVIGVPPGGSDQRVKAFVVLEDEASADADELIAFCSERLARFKVPRSIEFRDELPKTFVGKVLRRELAKEESEKSES
jgi:long-chain acyl-CoA synthetase